MTDPRHPGWPIWERAQRRHQESWERFRRIDEKAGRTPAPFRPLVQDPGAERLDDLVRYEAEQMKQEKVFEYKIATWTKLTTRQILAIHWVVDGGQEAVLFNVPSGTWIYDPVSHSEIEHQADEDPYVHLEPATREQAEAEAIRKGTTLPTPERLLEICRTQEGRELGMSATRSDRQRN